MKKKLLPGLLALLVALAPLAAHAAQIPLTLTLLEAGFDMDAAHAVRLEPVAGTNAMTLTRSQLDAALTFEMTLLTDVAVETEEEAETGYAASYFQVRDNSHVYTRKSLTTCETPDGVFYAWRVTVPTLSLQTLADAGIFRFAISFVAEHKPLDTGDVLTLDAPFTVTLYYLEDRPEVLEKTETVYGTFHIGSRAMVTGVRESLHVRVLPHEKSASVGRVHLLEVVELLDWDQTGAWVCIRYRNGQEGWVPFVNVTLVERP